MLTFKKYITEAAEGKNTHLEHLEDEVFNGGIAGTRKALEFLLKLRNMLAGHAKSKVNVTVKWDGAPAVICGINPENGKFFVGTKSVFNKEGKLNYTNKDIEKNHSNTDLQDKLKICLQELSKLGITGILQGDLLFTKGDLREVDIDGEPHLAFRPNTITYTVPLNSSLASRISNARLGIVFHTSYSGKTIQTAKASYGVDAAKLKQPSSVWATDATFRDESGTASLTQEETTQVSQMLAEIGKLFNQMDARVVNGIAGDNNLRLLIKTYTNAQIRTGLGIEGSKKYAKGLVDFIEARYQKEINALKTEKGKAGREETLKQLKSLLKSHREQLVLMFRIAELMSEVKSLLISKLKSVKSLGTFLETPDGFKVTSPEGFVAIDHIGNAIKLVDRLEFSRANFNLAKTW